MNTEKSKKLKFFSALNVCVLFAIIISGFYYLKSIDDLVSKNFELQNLKEKATLLEEENRNRELLKNELESHENMIPRIEDLKMVKVNGVHYINIGDDVLAKK